ncbi:VOC family protein [Nocardia donostiensis]|uniref:Glyoxalase n=1 Tax=Nocardia donostiensis TaxID=1538463 RepID=A0A1W0B6C6_9NOCA|nr:VOC family protein [Nocardia donostiensis]ONM50633.1 glyoxalase [Nocardia donostiensis]OQS18044.1 glyoxalase [Nocardia donostiensis]
MTTAQNTTTTLPTVWPCLGFRDAKATSDFLVEAFGFELTAIYTREDDPSVVEHGELRWPLGGGIMFGSAGREGGIPDRRVPGTESVYVVCDDPDALYERAVAAGAETVRGLKDEDYGSRGFTVADPEGNHWSFGTYRGQ